MNIACDNCHSETRTLVTRDDGKTWLCSDIIACFEDSLPVRIPVRDKNKGPTIIPVKVHYSN
jgi:hypothetical protein